MKWVSSVSIGKPFRHMFFMVIAFVFRQRLPAIVKPIPGPSSFATFKQFTNYLKYSFSLSVRLYCIHLYFVRLRARPEQKKNHVTIYFEFDVSHSCKHARKRRLFSIRCSASAPTRIMSSLKTVQTETKKRKNNDERIRFVCIQTLAHISRVVVISMRA